MRLSAISGEHQQYLVLGLHEPLVLARKLGLDCSNEQERHQLEVGIQHLVSSYSPLVTGVHSSSEIGYSASLSRSDKCGQIFSLEKALTEIDPLSIPILATNWNVEYVRNNESVASLTIWAHSSEVELINKLELVSELYDSCKYEGIDFLLQLNVIDGGQLADEDFQKEQLQLITIFQDQADALVLEYPRSALGCLDVTGQLKKPWLLRESSKSEYAAFKEDLRTALTGGAVGCVVSQLLVPTFAKGEFSLDNLDAFSQKEGRDRMLELGRICHESAQPPAEAVTTE